MEDVKTRNGNWCIVGNFSEWPLMTHGQHFRGAESFLVQWPSCNSRKVTYVRLSVALVGDKWVRAHRTR